MNEKKKFLKDNNIKDVRNKVTKIFKKLNYIF